MHNLLIICRYETKLLCRGVVFLLFACIAIGGIIFFQAVEQSNIGNGNYYGSLPSFIPLLNVWMFNVLQFLIASFLIINLFRRGQKVDTEQVLWIRPMSNAEYFWGKILGITILFLTLAIVVMFFAAIIHIFSTNTPFHLGIYFFYLLTLTIPSLAFVLGFSSIIIRLVKQAGVALLLILGYFLAVYFIFIDAYQNVFDPFALAIPTVFSDVIGHVGLNAYLLHRGSFLLLGIGLLILSEALFSRLADFSENKTMRKSLGAILISLGVLCSGWNVYTSLENQVTRESYKISYQSYAEKPKARVLTNEITYKQEESTFSAISRLIVANLEDTLVENLILYLNPTLKIESITSGDKAIKFTRENQVIVVEQALQPMDTIQLDIQYSGCIDERVYYLDIPDNNYKYIWNKHTIFPLGKRYVFVEKEYTLLTPGCLWYPVSVAPENPDSPWTVIKNFTNYTLHVIQPEMKCVISQGVSTRRGDTITFKNTEKLVGITLVVGEYERRTSQVDGVSVDLYLFKEHDTFSDLFTFSSIEYALQAVKEKMEQERGQAYPFKRLACIETPVPFSSYSREWNGGSELVQPEMVFLSERGIDLQCNFRRMFKEKESSNVDRKIIEDELLLNLLNNLFRGDRDLTPLYIHYQNYISSEEFPSINVVLNAMSKKRSDDFDRTFFLGNSPEFVGIHYLTSKSLKTALQDLELDKDVMAEIVRMKGLELRNQIASIIDWKEFERFLEAFKHKYKQDEITFETFCKDFLFTFKIDLMNLIKKWYTTDRIPMIIVKDIEVMRLETSEGRKYKLHFKVYNPSETDGLIFGNVNMSLQTGGSVNQEIRPEMISPQTCKQVKIVLPFQPRVINIRTGITRNLPNDTKIDLQSVRELNHSTEDAETGCFEISSSCFTPSPDEIVVDNEDAGFSVVETEKYRKLANVFSKEANDKYVSDAQMSSRWRYAIGNYFYGDTIRSAVGKEEGYGKGKAIWTAELPQEGYYEVFVHNVRSALVNVPVGVQLYTILHTEGETNVALEMGEYAEEWISAGQFYFAKGKAKVYLNDKKGERNKTQPSRERIFVSDLDGKPTKQVIFADAIKWKFLKK